MNTQHAHSRALARPKGRMRRPFVAACAAAVALPLLLQGTAAQAVVSRAESFAPIDAVEAITGEATLPGFQQQFLDEVNSQNIWNHDVYLADTIGPRVAGTAGEEAAAAYVETTLESYGFDTSRETFAATPQTFADVVPSRYQEGYASWQFKPATNAVFTGSDTALEGELIEIGSGTGDLTTRVDLVGKIVLVDWNAAAATRNAILKDLAGVGATGVVFAKVAGASSPEALPNPGSVPDEAQGLVVVGAALNQGERMRALLQDGPLSLSITTQTGSNQSTNVIGVREAANGDPEAPIVYIGAHIDSVVGSHGASDNGSGTSIMLELARILGSYSLDTEVRVGAWGAEEQGIKGSKHHASNVMTAEERDRTIGAWNMDMAGTNYAGTESQPFGFWALTVDGATKEDNPVLGLADTVSQIAGMGALQIGQVGRSDHQSFHDVGIPAVVFSWMFWAGGTNIVLEPAYHQTTDTLEFVSEERMAIAARVLGGSVFRAALEEVTIAVTDEAGEPAAAAATALRCEGDAGWRAAGDTQADGTVKTHAPATTCDVVAVGTDGSRGSAKSVSMSGDETVDIRLHSDKEAPVVSFTASNASASGWYRKAPVAVGIAATDNADDAPTIEFSLTGDDWAQYTDPVDLGADGRHTVWARASDDFKNVSEPAQHSVNIDTVAPQLQAAAQRSRGDIDLTIADATSGVARVEHRIKGADQWQQLAKDLEVQEGALSARVPLGKEAAVVELRAIDAAGNVSDIAQVEFAAGAEVTVEPVTPATPKQPQNLSNTGGSALWGGGLALSALLLVAGTVVLRRRRA
ncbi:M28 family peptidase [Leucobacter sp. HY1910]